MFDEIVCNVYNIKFSYENNYHHFYTVWKWVSDLDENKDVEYE